MRSRDQVSPQGGRGPPEKKQDGRTSPGQGSRGDNHTSSSPSKHRLPQRQEEDLIDLSQDGSSKLEGVDEWGEVVDDVVEVGVEMEGTH